jgi:small subunit ribosomal protein S1
LSWTKKIKHPSEVTELGATIEIQVLEVDKENRRLSLGHKQLEENPWEVFETVFTVGSVHEGTVVELLDKGAVISLPYGVEAFATSKFLVKEDGSQAQLDEKLDFRIVEFNKDSKRILVSHSRTFEEDQTDAQKSTDSKKKPSSRRTSRKKDDVAASAPSTSVEKSTLGDIEELAALKEKLDNKKISEAKAVLDKKEAEAEKAEAETSKTEEAKEAIEKDEPLVAENAVEAKKVTAAAEEKAEEAKETEEGSEEEETKSEE